MSRAQDTSFVTTRKTSLGLSKLVGEGIYRIEGTVHRHNIGMNVQGKSGTMCKIVLKSKGNKILIKKDWRRII